ncbi:MAG: DUF5026 domain-containing protein [Lachnospiraceae bacterium]|nr:DUF5026 domain-containing protein [Lachnospiraceae bacterium]
MGLLKESTNTLFDTDAIQKGAMIYAKHECWDEAKSGIVSAVKSDGIRVLYHPNIANVTAFFNIFADDVANGEWQIRWSEDLETIYQYPEELEEGNADDV